MQRSSSKLGQLCHSASSLRSLQRRTVTSLSSDTASSHGTDCSKGEELLESLHEFIEDASPSRVQDKQSIVRKGGMGVLDRAANWAHVKPMRKRRVPPLGVPQLSIENILKVPQDIFDDEVFDTELGDKALPKGSFLEIRRSVHTKPILFSSIHHSECVGATE